MRWILVNCILLATAADVLSSHRSKRDLPYIKNLIGSKLLGTETVMVQLPEIPKNETFKLFKIKGYDNILLKVIRKPEKKENKNKEQTVTEKTQDPIIVKPEIAIIGNYLDTKTQGETLLAIEIAKNLLKSGILSGKREKYIKEVVVPITSQLFYKDYTAQEPVKHVNLYTEEKNPIYVLPPASGQAERIRVMNRDPIPVFPAQYSPLVVASEVSYRPLQTKYSYKQKGEIADMTYESYNNQDVIVTRTAKEPPLPQYIKLRFAEVASIGSSPYLIQSRQPIGVTPEEHLAQLINVVPGSYGYLNPSMVVQDYVQPTSIPTYVMERFRGTPKPVPSIGVINGFGYVVDNINNPPILDNINPTVYSEPLAIPNFINNTKLHLDLKDHLSDAEDNKIDHLLNEKINRTQNNEKASLNVSSNISNFSLESVNVDQKETVKGIHKVSKQIKPNNHIVTKYLYNQMNHRSHDNYTVIKIEDPLS